MNVLAIFKPKVKVYDLEPLPEYRGDGAIKGRQVALWRPPVMLDQAGRTMPGISKELIAHYLVATTSALARQDLGPVSVEWGEQQGRFATTELTIHAWGQAITVMHPIATISQDLANALEHYRAGMAHKVRELHKGHQRLDEANAAIRRSMRQVEKLRDDDLVHFSDAEYLFLQANLSKALTLSALIPVSDQAPEPVFDGLVIIGR
jgi:hypothetical protein